MAEGWRTQPGINATHAMDDDVCVIKYSHIAQMAKDVV